MLFQIAPSAVPDGYGEALLPLAACKAWLRILDDEFDPLITALRDAAIDAVEQYTGCYLAPRTGLVATFAGFDGAAAMRLGRGPEASIAVQSVAYADSTGTAIAMDGSAWRWAVGGLLPAIGTSWPSGASQVAVTFSAGFPAGTCPAGLITAAKMFLAHLFANPEAVVTQGAAGELPLGFRMLCDQHRLIAI